MKPREFEWWQGRLVRMGYVTVAGTAVAAYLNLIWTMTFPLETLCLLLLGYGCRLITTRRSASSYIHNPTHEGIACCITATMIISLAVYVQMQIKELGPPNLLEWVWVIVSITVTLLPFEKRAISRE